MWTGVRQDWLAPKVSGRLLVTLLQCDEVLFSHKMNADLLSSGAEFEPYDHDLAKRITSMHTAIEGLNLQLAATRREAVARAARQFEESFSIENGEIDETLARYTEIARRAGEATGEEDRLSTGFEGREADVQRIWENAAEGLKRLQPELEATKGRAEGALKVVDYLEGR